MPERHANAEAAHVLLERAGRHPAAVEILEAFLLALVAVATAWSGYQAVFLVALSQRFPEPWGPRGAALDRWRARSHFPIPGHHVPAGVAAGP